MPPKVIPAGGKPDPRAEAIRLRITRHAIVPAKDLVANPLNFRVHPETQKKAVGEAIDKLGWVGEVLVNERTGHLIDGHLRVEREAAKNADVPVAYVDLSEEEERLALASLDPLSALAIEDEGRLRSLLDSLTTIDHDSVLGSFLSTNLQDAALIGLTREENPSPDGRSKRLSGHRTNICLVIPITNLARAEKAIAATGLQNRGEAIDVIFRKYLDAIGQFDLSA